MAGIRQTNNRPGRYRISTGKSAGSARSSRSSRTSDDDERGGLHFGVKGRTVKKTRKNTTIDPVAAQEREETRRALTVATITTAKRAFTTSRAGTMTLPTAGSSMRMHMLRRMQGAF